MQMTPLLPAASAEVPSEAFSLSAVVICSTGEARGHGVWADYTFLEQVGWAGNRSALGVKARFGHALPGTDPVGSELGRFSRFRLRYLPQASTASSPNELWQLVADFQAIPTDLNAPKLAHLRQLADQDPGLLGCSIEFVPAPLAPAANPAGLPHERLAELLAIAITSDPAVNLGGLFRRASA